VVVMKRVHIYKRAKFMTQNIIIITYIQVELLEVVTNICVILKS